MSDEELPLGAGLIGCPVREMTAEEAELFVGLNPLVHPTMSDDLWREVRGEFAIGIAVKRFEATNVAYDRSLLTFCASLCNNPAKVVMWCYTLHVMTARLGRPATLLDYATDYFPHGVPTEDAYQELWSEQKHPDAPLGNAFDVMIAWPGARSAWPPA